jgi:hypothetical protein
MVSELPSGADAVKVTVASRRVAPGTGSERVSCTFVTRPRPIGGYDPKPIASFEVTTLKAEDALHIA